MPVLHARLSGEISSGTESLNPGTIVAIIFAAVIPVIIITSFAAFFLCFYGRRPCCCSRRRRNSSSIVPPPEEPPMVQNSDDPFDRVRPLRNLSFPPKAARPSESSQSRRWPSWSSRGSDSSRPSSGGDLGEKKDARTFV